MTQLPPLRMAVLTALVEVQANLSLLDDPQCPYDEETVALLKTLLAPKTVEVTIEKEVFVKEARGRGRPSKDVQLSDEDKALLTDGIKELIEALNAMGTGEGLAMNERIQITKTKTTLLGELLKMRERNTTATRSEEYMETVIGILDELVTEADRDTFLKRLEPYR